MVQLMYISMERFVLLKSFESMRARQFGGLFSWKLGYWMSDGANRRWMCFGSGIGC